MINSLIRLNKEAAVDTAAAFSYFTKTIYQNLTYSAARIISMATINATVCGFNFIIDLSETKDFGLILGPAKLINIMVATVKKKTSPY